MTNQQSNELDEVIEEYVGVLRYWSTDEAKELAKQALNRYIDKACREARIDELQLLARSTAELTDKETWKDWSWRVTKYMSERIADLKSNKGTAHQVPHPMPGTTKQHRG